MLIRTADCSRDHIAELPHRRGRHPHPHHLDLVVDAGRPRLGAADEAAFHQGPVVGWCVHRSSLSHREATPAGAARGIRLRVAHADRCHFPQGPRTSCAYALSICHLDAFPGADMSLLSVVLAV